MHSGQTQLITIHFTIKDKRGAIVDSTEGQEPYSFISQTCQMFPKIEEMIEGMEVGGKKSITLAPADAYGDYNNEAVMVAPRSNFPKGAELKEGMTLLTMRGGSETPVIIKKIDGENITVDFNHPMAGETVSFEVELLDRREVDPDEFGEEDCGCGCSH